MLDLPRFDVSSIGFNEGPSGASVTLVSDPPEPRKAPLEPLGANKSWEGLETPLIPRKIGTGVVSGGPSSDLDRQTLREQSTTPGDHELAAFF